MKQFNDYLEMAAGYKHEYGELCRLLKKYGAMPSTKPMAGSDIKLFNFNDLEKLNNEDDEDAQETIYEVENIISNLKSFEVDEVWDGAIKPEWHKNFDYQLPIKTFIIKAPTAIYVVDPQGYDYARYVLGIKIYNTDGE